MGKASSGKKVARAAKAGGARARAAGERSIIFPLAVVLVVVLGTALILFARQDRLDAVLTAPVAGQDHWHAAFAFNVCGTELPHLPEFESETGIHTHGDGVVHIHPFSAAGGGDNATLGTFLNAATSGAHIGSQDFEVTGTEYGNGYDCDGEKGQVRVLYWADASTASETDPEVITENIDDLKFQQDGEAYVITDAPADAEIAPPSTAGNLAELGVVDGASNDRDENATTTTPDSTVTDDSITDDSVTDDSITDDSVTDDSVAEDAAETPSSTP